MVDKVCAVCGGKTFRTVTDEWMKRTFRFVEAAGGQLQMCDGCGAKFYACPKCGALMTRVHPALEAWEVDAVCKNCGYEDPEIKAWDGVSPR
ncbi:MAG: hypothetical protein Kow0069_09440 [Promethearchaeota archaeon]